MEEAEAQAGSGTPFDGTFRLLDELGRGARGVVFHALQQPLEEPVAIKVLHERLPEDAPGRDQFNEEVRAFAGLDHANLVSIGSFGIAGEAPYIVMELLEGETVAARLARGPIDPGEAESLIQTMLRAVAHLHLRGLVHRNLSPGAMFLHHKDHREQLKLIDYGLSRFTENTDAGRVAVPSPYVSPEQAAGDDTDARTDVYAAGAIIMRLFGGDLPPSAANDNGSLRPAARIHPGASPQLDALVARALAPNRQERFGNADQMLKALLELPSPWVSAETEANEAIPVASNAPPLGETAEVAVAEEEAPAAARHNTPPPIPEAKHQPVPIVKMILAAMLGALLAGGGVALWVARKDAAHQPAEAGRGEQTVDAKPADKHEPQAEHAKTNAGEHAGAQAEKPKADNPLLKVEDEIEEQREAEKAPGAKHDAHDEKAEAEKPGAKTEPAAQAKPGAQAPHDDKHAEPEHLAAHGGAPSAKAAEPRPPTAADEHAQAEKPQPKAAADKHADAENPQPKAAADKHADAENPQPKAAADKHADAEKPQPKAAADKHADAEKPQPKAAADKHADAEKPQPKAAADKHADAENPQPRAAADEHADAENPQPRAAADEHADAKKPQPAEQHTGKPESAAQHADKPQPPEPHADGAHATDSANANAEHGPSTPPEAQTPAEPPPPIGAERHVKPQAFEIRAMLAMAQQPKKPRAKAKDPWEDATVPTALESLRRSIDKGEPGKPNQISALRHYNAANPDDVHGHLLLAGLYKNRGWDADALDEYDMAYQVDSSSRGAPEILPHVLYMVAHDEAVDDATRFIVRAYQREALGPLDRAIRDSKDAAATARLKKLRARVQSGR